MIGSLPITCFTFAVLTVFCWLVIICGHVRLSVDLNGNILCLLLVLATFTSKVKTCLTLQWTFLLVQPLDSWSICQLLLRKLAVNFFHRVDSLSYRSLTCLRIRISSVSILLSIFSVTQIVDKLFSALLVNLIKHLPTSM